MTTPIDTAEWRRLATNGHASVRIGAKECLRASDELDALRAENERLRAAMKKIAGSWGWLNGDKEARREMLNIAVAALEGSKP